MVARILVIEDNPLNMELVVYTLRAFGYEPLLAYNGKAGMEMARAQTPDVILCDIQLPDIDGLTIARTLKADPDLRKIPLVGASAYAMQDDYDLAYAAGFDAYLTKPLDFNKLLSTLRMLVRHEEEPSNRSMQTGPHAAYHSTRTPPPTGTTILLVDDVPVNLEVKRCLFEPLGYTVELAPDMATGLEIAKRVKPDLILSDVAMPNGDGLEFLERIKSDPELRDIPLILITAVRLDDYCRERGLQLGAAKFLYRPIDMDDLRDAVEQCLRGKGIID